MATFKDDLVTDLEETFFNEEDFAEEITYNPDGGAPYAISSIFDNEYEATDPDTQQPILSLNPTVLINANDLAAPVARADTVTVRGKTYKFTWNQPDGTGPIRILLNEEV